MAKLNRKFTISILILFFLISVINFLSRGESDGLIYGILSYILFFDKSKITKYDFIFAGSLVLGVILMFINIFYKNILLSNFYSLFICGLSIFIYLKKSGTNHE
ncbi:MAG: hypothetical protein ACERKZ_13260 [Lachnotalea sp.]